MSRFGVSVLRPVRDYRGGQRLLSWHGFGNGVRITVLGWRFFIRWPNR